MIDSAAPNPAAAEIPSVYGLARVGQHGLHQQTGQRQAGADDQRGERHRQANRPENHLIQLVAWRGAGPEHGQDIREAKVRGADGQIDDGGRQQRAEQRQRQ